MQLQCKRQLKRNDEEKKEVRTKGDLYLGLLDNKRYREKYERIRLLLQSARYHLLVRATIPRKNRHNRGRPR